MQQTYEVFNNVASVINHDNAANATHTTGPVQHLVAQQPEMPNVFTGTVETPLVKQEKPGNATYSPLTISSDDGYEPDVSGLDLPEYSFATPYKFLDPSKYPATRRASNSSPVNDLDAQSGLGRGYETSARKVLDMAPYNSPLKIDSREGKCALSCRDKTFSPRFLCAICYICTPIHITLCFT